MNLTVCKEKVIVDSITKYLKENNPDKSEYDTSNIEKRKLGEKFSLSDHIRGMTYSLLSAEREWKVIENNIHEVNEVFYNFDIQKIENISPQELEQKIKDIHCGNRRIKYQMIALKENIKLLQSYEQEYGSVDKFYATFEDKYKLVNYLSSKFKELGIALVCEYLPSVGYDLPKPDKHIRTLFGNERLAYSMEKQATLNEVFKIFKDFSESTGEYQKSIDVKLWSYCAQGQCGICGENPKCDMCVINQYCNKNTKRQLMQVTIYSREEVEELLKGDFPKNTAVISFYDPKLRQIDDDYMPVDYSKKCNMVFQVALDDLDIYYLGEKGFTYDTYFPEVDNLAKFIHKAFNSGMDIICQCEYGQSRSAGCASAILEYFYKSGISVFIDYKRYPNQVVYHKVFDALVNTEKFSD